MKPLRIIKLTQTCDACPSQWDAVGANGEDVYIRYRWGKLSVDVDNEPHYYDDCGESLDGVMSTDDLCKKLQAENVLDFSELGK